MLWVEERRDVREGFGWENVGGDWGVRGCFMGRGNSRTQYRKKILYRMVSLFTEQVI